MKCYKIKKAIICFVIALFAVSSVYAQVQVEDLKGNTLDSFGLKKTLPFTSWGKVPFDKLKEITLELSEQKKSQVLEEFVTKVLIQQTLISPGKWSEEQSAQWMEVRLQALLNLSRADLVLQMIKQLPASFITKEILRIKADASLLENDWKSACSIALQNSENVYLNTLQMFCLGLMGEKDKAQLAFDLWQEEHKDENMPAFVMGQLIDMPVDEPQGIKNLTIAETYVLLQSKSTFLEKATLPLAYRKLDKRLFSGFGKAIDVKKLFEMWKEAGLDEQQQAYRFYLVNSYANLFLPNLRFIHKNVIWGLQSSEQNFLLQSIFLKDKPKKQITGADLLLGLWLINRQTMNIENVFVLLNEGGLNLEPFILEQMNP